MVEGKWVPGLNANMPASEAAERVLTVRFKAVASALAPAVDAPDEIEHVHQLRVATRRASAALRIFRSLVPKKVQQKTRQLLRVLRRSAGEARNWDVFLDGLDQFTTLQQKDSQDTLNFLTGFAFRERDVSQVLLSAVAAEYAKAISKLWKELPKKLRKPSSSGPTVSELGETVLTELITDVTQKIQANPNTPEERHLLRISCKRLRYAVEIFAAALPNFFKDELLPMTCKLQETLGVLQDSHVMVSRMTAMLDSMRELNPNLHAKHGPTVLGMIEESRSTATEEMKNYHAVTQTWIHLIESEAIIELLVAPTIVKGKAG